MANMDILDMNLGSVVIKNPEFETGLLQFPGADTYVEGTILARKEVALAITPAAGAENTGNGTCTLATVAGPGVPKVGTWQFIFTAALVGKLVDPDGIVVASNIAIADGAGIVLNYAGLQFTITDGGTAFAADDYFDLPVVADGDWVIYDKDGVGGAEIPKGVLLTEEVATTATDVPTRVLIKGVVRTDKLVIDAGDTVTNAIKDALREVGIVALDTTDLSVEDND